MANELEVQGILRSAKPVSSAPCPDCGNLLRVQIEIDRPTKRARGYISCPNCGINETELDLLRRWNIDVERLLLAVFGRLKATVSLSRLVPNRLWRVGKAKLAGRHRELLFALPNCGNSEDEISVVGKRPKSILFVLTESDAVQWSAVSMNVVIALESVVSTAGDGIALDVAYAEAKIVAAEPKSPEKRRRIPKKRGSRVANIEALKKALMDHIRAARDHGVATRDLTGEAELLPCPTKEKFGGLAGKMKPHTVSRCFSDPAGHELRILWKLAHDLDKVISYRS